MDRQIVFPSAIPQDTDILKTNKNAMIGLGYALQAIVGTQTIFDGLQCTPTSPPGLFVNVAPGSVMSMQNTDATAYGSLAADTTTQITKQGLSLSTMTYTLATPPASGQSIVYLIQGQYQDVDGGSAVLPYYNASNPSVPYSGPGNAGTPNYTVRQGKCILSVKAGVAAPTGSQAAPAPDAGYTALWAITVPNGATAITSANIAQVGNPFIGTKLQNKLNVFSNLADVANAATALQNLGGAPFSAFLAALNTSGFQKIAGGLIIQWGVAATVGAGSFINVTLPTPYPNQQFMAVTTPAVDINGTIQASTAYSLAGINPLTQLVVRNLGSTSYNIAWISIGY